MLWQLDGVGHVPKGAWRASIRIKDRSTRGVDTGTRKPLNLARGICCLVQAGRGAVQGGR